MSSVLSRMRQGKSTPNQRLAITLAHHSPQRERGGPSQSKGALVWAAASEVLSLPLAAGLSGCASSMPARRPFWPPLTEARGLAASASAARFAVSRSLT